MKKPCPTCPFLEVNRGKPNPTGFKCEAENETEWYSDENINSVWEIMRMRPVEFLSCHSSDPDYFGREKQPVFACVGAAFLVYMHIKIYGALLEKHNSTIEANYKRYVNAVGKDVAMNLFAMGEKALAIKFGRTSPLWGNMILPTVLEVDLALIRWPKHFKKTVEKFNELFSDENNN